MWMKKYKWDVLTTYSWVDSSSAILFFTLYEVIQCYLEYVHLWHKDISKIYSMFRLNTTVLLYVVQIKTIRRVKR